MVLGVERCSCFGCPLSFFHSMAQCSSVASCTLPQELNQKTNWKRMLIYWILIRKRKINLGASHHQTDKHWLPEADCPQFNPSLVVCGFCGLVLWAIGVSCPSCIPSQTLAHPTHWGGNWGEKGDLDALQARLSSCQNTGELPTLF